MLKFMLVIAGTTLVFIGVGIWLVQSPGTVPTTGAVIVAFGAIAVIASAAFRLLWNPMLSAFPARPPAPDAVRRRFQSFGLGIVNMGLSIHAAVDDDALHLTPLAVWRWLGAQPASIPWDAMEPVGTSGRVVRVNGHRLDGPKWCMSLARPSGPG